MGNLLFYDYGSVMDVETTGASPRTAAQDNLTCSGVRASCIMAKTDSELMKLYKKDIEDVGREYGIESALIAGIISRESRAGKALKDGGWGDWSPRRNAYNAFGLMQVDVNPNGGAHVARGKWNDKTHLRQGTEILVHFIGKISGKQEFRGCTKEQKLKGGIAAYNMGDGNVKSYAKVDENTTGKDYSNDVVARARWYRENGYSK